MTGTLVNMASILVGGGLGLLFRGKIPPKMSEGITKALGLCVCVIGVSGALQGDTMLLVSSLALGALTGELLHIDAGLNRFGDWLQKKFSRSDKKSTFSEGFVTTTLLFCVGAMAIVGSIDSGLRGDRSIIFTKSILDGFSAMLFASTLGYGVLFSAVTVLVYQGSIEIFAGALQNILTPALVTQISAAGSVMILGIGLIMTVNIRLKVANLLPGLLFAVAYYYLFLQ
ncbi:MAG: DUF554 domain-containing protein [Oscillospiraceae bacterium]|nr:DUF554 domain-containing protein [Oscillospiraceae bacterium]